MATFTFLMHSIDPRCGGHRRYVAAFYWAVMTTTTVGYGDVSSRGTAQRLFGVLTMVIGCLLFGYMVSFVVAIVEEFRKSEKMFREKIDTFNHYMRMKDVPRELQDGALLKIISPLCETMAN